MANQPQNQQSHLSNLLAMPFAFQTIVFLGRVLPRPVGLKLADGIGKWLGKRTNNPNASYQLQNKIRENLGINVTPMDLDAFREARNRLQNGGSILTGLDRPLESQRQEKYRPTFFGYECPLPVAYVRMAKEANAPVIVMAAASQPDQSYRLIGSKPIWMESFDDLETEILTNANRVLSESERLIRTYARQWAMFYPIWPQFLGV